MTIKTAWHWPGYASRYHSLDHGVVNPIKSLLSQWLISIL